MIASEWEREVSDLHLTTHVQDLFTRQEAERKTCPRNVHHVGFSGYMAMKFKEFFPEAEVDFAHSMNKA